MTASNPNPNPNSVSAAVLRVAGVEATQFSNLSSFKELPHWDSLSLMQLLTILENELKIELSVDEVVNLTPARVRELYDKA